MSYESKYLKYKQKYVELKEKLEKALPSDVYTEILISDTPTINMTGGAKKNSKKKLRTNSKKTSKKTSKKIRNNILETDIEDFSLTDTPQEFTGGYVPDLTPAPVENMGSGVPNCDGMVNTQPDVQQVVDPAVDVVQSGGSYGDVAPAEVNLTAPTSCSGQVNSQPNTNVEIPPQNTVGSNVPTNEAVMAPVNNAASNKYLSNSIEETTTDLSDTEVQNTEDLHKIFNQLGGKRTDSDESTPSSSSLDGSDSSLSSSDSDYLSGPRNDIGGVVSGDPPFTM